MDAISLSAMPMMPGRAGAAAGLPVSPRKSAEKEPALQPAPAEMKETLPDAEQADRARVERIRRVAEQLANVYVVSDQRFTIFKDASGQYITRFTSLRDGRVTYIPEPDLLMFLKRQGDTPGPIMELNV